MDQRLLLEGTKGRRPVSCGDPSVDYLRAACLPVLIAFGVDESEAGLGAVPAPGDDSSKNPTAPFLTVLRRGASPGGGGAVLLSYQPLRISLRSGVDLSAAAKIKRVRGTVASCRLPSASASRAASVAKGAALRLLPDVWI